jgi:hypothetical protein
VVGIVLGVSMAPTNVRMVLVEGESARRERAAAQVRSAGRQLARGDLYQRRGRWRAMVALVVDTASATASAADSVASGTGSRSPAAAVFRPRGQGRRARVLVAAEVVCEVILSEVMAIASSPLGAGILIRLAHSVLGKNA